MSASLSEDADVEETAREVTADVRLVARARRVRHLENSLLNCRFRLTRYDVRIC